MLGRRYFRLVVVALLLPAVPSSLCAQASPTNPEANRAPSTQRVDAASFALRSPASIPRTPFTPGVIGLRQLTRAAGTIFSGMVISVAPESNAASRSNGSANESATPGDSVATIAITFRVEQAFRGVISGDIVTIRQWMGLWSSGQRYRVGERVLLFLYPPSKLGLTSCVGGSFGRFSVDSLGRITLTDQHFAAFRADPILGGKSRVTLTDFADALHRATGVE